MVLQTFNRFKEGEKRDIFAISLLFVPTQPNDYGLVAISQTELEVEIFGTQFAKGGYEWSLAYKKAI